MKIYTNWAFLRPVLHLPLWRLYYRKPSFSMYLLSTQEHTIPLCIKILQILFQLELSWFWIRPILDWRKWPFLRFFDFLCTIVHHVRVEFWIVRRSVTCFTPQLQIFFANNFLQTTFWQQIFFYIATMQSPSYLTHKTHLLTYSPKKEKWQPAMNNVTITSWLLRLPFGTISTTVSLHPWVVFALLNASWAKSRPLGGHH